MTTPAHRRLREARVAAGHTSAAEAARRYGWQVPAYRHHENGTRSFDIDQAKAYGSAFRVSPAWLAGLSETPELDPFKSFANAVLDPPHDRPEWFSDYERTLKSKFGLLLIPEVAIGQDSVVFENSDDEYANQFHAFEEGVLHDLAKVSVDWLCVIRANDDEMSPPIKLAALSIVDRAQREILDQDRIWAILYAGAGLFRRIRRHPDGNLECFASAPGRPSLVAPEGHIKVFGKVVWVGAAI